MRSTVCVKRGPFEIHTPTHWKLIGRCACHRPAVFFRHLYIALSFAKKENFGALLKDCHHFNGFLLLEKFV
jgi:hypothetical protein